MSLSMLSWGRRLRIRSKEEEQVLTGPALVANNEPMLRCDAVESRCLVKVRLGRA